MRYALLRVQINGDITEKLIKPGTQVRFVHPRSAANKQSRDGGQGFVKCGCTKTCQANNCK